MGFRRIGRSELDGQDRPYPLIHLRHVGGRQVVNDGLKLANLVDIEEWLGRSHALRAFVHECNWDGTLWLLDGLSGLASRFGEGKAQVSASADDETVAHLYLDDR